MKQSLVFAETIPEAASRISEYRRIIAFRNHLLHGYYAIRNEITWQIVEEKLPILRAEVHAMLQEADTN